MIGVKNIYKAEDIKFADYFRSKQQALIDDFLKVNPNWAIPGGEYDKATQYLDDYGKLGDHMRHTLVNNPGGWNLVGIKRLMTKTLVEERREIYPTVFEIADFFGRNCTAMSYSTFEPNTILRRHTGGENRDGLNVRIHVPLIIPEGDIGLEVWGEEVHWEDIFGFDNQKSHSAWNLTPQRRLVLIIDLLRSHCGIEDSPEWYPGCNDNAPPFPKTAVEGEVWANTKQG